MGAGNKKKKKPAVNPARGFATTSIVSKGKAEKAPNTSNDTSETSSIITAPTSASPEEAQAAAAPISPKDRELHELSPEELEAQLEQSELQHTIEQQGPKARKESSRQTTRLQNDRRILRQQAENLAVREWLPDELMQQVIDFAIDDAAVGFSSDMEIGSFKHMSEDAVLARVWQLYLVLQEIDISDDRITQALQYVLSLQPPDDPASNIWGLPQVLDWLALHALAGELLDYETMTPKRVLDTAEMPFDADTDDTASGHPNKSSTRQQDRSSTQINGQDSSPYQVDDIEVSDVESDMDPDEMLSTYLSTKLRLFQRNPNLAVDSGPNGKRSGNQGKSKGASVLQVSPGEAKLQQRLKNLELDVLFDSQNADYQWSLQRNELLRESAERKRLRVEEQVATPPQTDRENKANSAQGGSNNVMNEAEELGRLLLEEVNGDEELLGGMFDAPTELGSSEAQPGSVRDGPEVLIRNFGKLSGMSPRRILEDACRSRDSKAHLTYKMISPTTYSSRHSVTIQWSKDQPLVEASDLPDLKVSSNERAMRIEMIKVAASETAQSEGYVSTAALFLLFSGSPKEEKASLRLPVSFRELWQEFVEVRKNRLDSLDRQTVKNLRDLVRDQRERDDNRDVVLTAGFKNRSKAASGVNTPNGTSQHVAMSQLDASQELQHLWQRKISTPAYQHMLAGRMNLPMYQFRDVALSVVRQNQITILCGETGCGKSTQMPAFILEDELSNGRPCKIYCTEPRRISAISLAQRVSEELGEGKGAAGTARSLVGYAIRLESQTTASTRLVYATVGIVLRMLESAKGLTDVTHLVIDEIHERSIDTDFLLIVLRSLLVRRPDLKVVLMSATVDAQRFSSYLDNAPIVTVPGRTFPVQPLFLEDAIELTGHTNEGEQRSGPAGTSEDDDDIEDSTKTISESNAANQMLVGYTPKTKKTLASYDEYKLDYALIIKLLETVAYSQQFKKFSKAILVFLPGIAEIRQLNDMLGGHRAFAQGWQIFPLHSSFTSEEQQQAFQVPPPGMRKIVLATNIAETGITIPDVTCVVDTGKHKEMRFDERRQLSRLIQSFISRANAKQRRGRAGRVQEGICFHLFTRYRHDHIMAEQQTPEMLRLSLQDLVMRVKICKLGDIEHALSSALDPPSLKNVRRAIDALVDVDALTTSEELTPLGQQLAKLPLDAQLGKLVLFACSFGCLDFALTTAAILSSKSPFHAPMNAKKQADSVRLGYKRGDSDLLTAYNAYAAWRRVCTTSGGHEFQFCKKNFLSQQNLSNIEDLKGQLLASLADAGFVTLDSSERSALSRARNSGPNRIFVTVPSSKTYAETNDLLVNSVTAWSLYPKVLTRDGKGWRNLANNASVSLHPNSVNKGVSGLDAKYLSFYSMMQSNSRFTNAQETSPVSDMALVLLAGDASFYMYAGVIVIDGNRLRFKVRDWRTMIVLKTLRARVKDILAKGFKSPGRELSARQTRWMDLFLGMFGRGDEKKK